MEAVVMQPGIPPRGLHPSTHPCAGLVDGRYQVFATLEDEYVAILVPIDVRPLRKIFMNPDQIIDRFVIQEDVIKRGVSRIGSFYPTLLYFFGFFLIWQFGQVFLPALTYGRL
jgi:hypothetical protein